MSLKVRLFCRFLNMKAIILFSTILALAAADKPSPTYTASSPKQTADKRQDSYGSPQAPVAQDSYGSPQAPAQDSYGSPQAPVQDSYGSPQAPVQDSYGSPQASVQTSYSPQKTEAVAPSTQGFYYYYYPVASTYSGSGHAPAPAPSNGGGLLGGNLLLPLLIGLGLLVALAVAAATIGAGRRSFDSFNLADVDTEQLTNLVYDGIRLWTEVTSE